MNELLAIIIIVVVCCAMFFAWLISMATCPDKMVNWISGAANSASGTASNESKELIVPQDDDDDESLCGKNIIGHNSNIFLQLSSSRKTSKKLSVVPEQDENLTVQSMRNQPRPSILQYQQHLQHQSPQISHSTDPNETIVEADVEQEPTFHEEVINEGEPEPCYDYQATISSTASSIELRSTTSPPPELPLRFSHVLHHSLGDVVHAV
uniref:Uncharacterized protein n=1 Tax=Acrobeloides nanus TaxID=290746 RepID=A0A914D0S5_9BILA